MAGGGAIGVSGGSGEQDHAVAEAGASVQMKSIKEVRMPADIILHNAKIATNSVPSFVEAIAIKDGKIRPPVPMTRFCGWVGRRRK